MTKKKAELAPDDESIRQAYAAMGDPASAEIVLAYVVGGRSGARNAPPRHLSGSDIARLAYREALHAGPDGERPDPRNPDPEHVADIVAELLASGRYTTDLSVLDEEEPAAEEAADPDPDLTPADPATSAPEG